LKRSATTTANVTVQHTLPSLLSVSLSHLDSEAEMRKFFGSKVIAASRSAVAGSSRRRPATQRSYLAHVQAGWSAPRMHEGLSISQLTREELTGKLIRHSWDPIEDEKWWRVEYSKKYKSATMSFMKTVASGGEFVYANC
jgi:hypothetical protein